MKVRAIIEYRRCGETERYVWRSGGLIRVSELLWVWQQQLVEGENRERDRTIEHHVECADRTQRGR